MSSAAKDRARLAAIGCDLVARDGGPAARRGASLLRRIDGRDEGIIAFEDLPRVPAWARLPRAAQRKLAERAALASIANDLAYSIDGEWLGAHAAQAGDDAVDWAIGLAGKAPTLPTVDSAALSNRGYGLLDATLEAPLKPLLDWHPENAAPVPADVASECLKLAMQGAA